MTNLSTKIHLGAFFGDEQLSNLNIQINERLADFPIKKHIKVLAAYSNVFLNKNQKVNYTSEKKNSCQKNVEFDIHR